MTSALPACTARARLCLPCSRQGPSLQCGSRMRVFCATREVHQISCRGWQQPKCCSQVKASSTAFPIACCQPGAAQVERSLSLMLLNDSAAGHAGI